MDNVFVGPNSMVSADNQPISALNFNPSNIKKITSRGNSSNGGLNRSFFPGTSNNTFQGPLGRGEGIEVEALENMDRRAVLYGGGYLPDNAPALPALPASALVASVEGTDQIKLSWNTVAGAVSYQLSKLVAGAWQILQNNNTTSFTDTGLTAGTQNQYRLKVVADGTSNSDSVYDTETVTTDTEFFQEQFTGAAAAYTTSAPQIGTGNIRAGSVAKNGNGGGVFAGGGYSVYEATTAIPANHKGIARIIDLPDPAGFSIVLRQKTDFSQFVSVSVVTVDATHVKLGVYTEAGPVEINNSIEVTYPFIVKASKVGNVITGSIGNIKVAYTDNRPNIPDALEFQTNPSGATLDYLSGQTAQ